MCWPARSRTLIDPDRPNQLRRAPHHADPDPDLRAERREGMTERQHVCSPDTPAMMRATPIPPDIPPQEIADPDRRQLNNDAPNGTGLKALRPLTRSGYARALTPIPYLGAPSNCAADRERPARAT